MTSSRTDVQKGQYATFLRQKSKSKMSVLQINVIQRRGVISHDLQTGFLVLKAKELLAFRCSQVREKKNKNGTPQGRDGQRTYVLSK